MSMSQIITYTCDCHVTCDFLSERLIYNPVRIGYSIKLETCMPKEILSSLFRHRLCNLHVAEDVILGHVAIPSKQEYGMSTRQL